MFKKNQQYRLIGFQENCPKPYQLKLLSLGFIPQTIFTLTQCAPLGDPFQIEIKGSKLMMRISELHLLKLEQL